MLPQHLYNHLLEVLSLHLGQKVNTFFAESIGGGSINQTYRLQLPGNDSFFCKINSASRFPHLFLKEKRGLQVLAETGQIKVPKVVAYTAFDDNQVLLLEWIESGTKDKSFFSYFGRQLAALHQCHHHQFGFDADNYMGSVPQQNTFSNDWCTFFTEQRLQPLVKKCNAKNLLDANDINLFEKVYKRLPQIFDDAQQPALLHGDLWSGNYMCNEAGEPVLIDPAVYYGHPAMDLGMTTLFGGFDSAFYESYNDHLPLLVNHKEQWQICNLYPLLIHLLLFGKGYLSGIRQTTKAFA